MTTRASFGIPAALGVTSLVTVASFAASVAMLDFAEQVGALTEDPSWVDENIDGVLRGIAVALLVPAALLSVATTRNRAQPTPEVR
jgi:hypothetical protein